MAFSDRNGNVLPKRHGTFIMSSFHTFKRFYVQARYLIRDSGVYWSRAFAESSEVHCSGSYRRYTRLVRGVHAPLDTRLSGNREVADRRVVIGARATLTPRNDSAGWLMGWLK